MNRQDRAKHEDQTRCFVFGRTILSPPGPSGRAIVGPNVLFVLFDEAEPDCKVMPSAKQRYKLDYYLVFLSIFLALASSRRRERPNPTEQFSSSSVAHLRGIGDAESSARDQLI